jgi:hypothetical protein
MSVSKRRKLSPGDAFHFLSISLSASPRQCHCRCKLLLSLSCLCHRTTAYQIVSTASPPSPLPRHPLRWTVRAPMRPHFWCYRREKLVGALPCSRSSWLSSLASFSSPLCSVARSQGSLEDHAMLGSSHHGRGWPAHLAQRRCTRHCWRRVLLANPRNPKAPPSMRNHMWSMMVPSVSPAGSSAVSSHRHSSLPCLYFADARAPAVSTVGRELAMGRAARPGLPRSRVRFRFLFFFSFIYRFEC